jgi:ATP-dependent Clp protease ATP-binding subunit ClpA
MTEDGREFLLEEGTDQRYGARHLKRAIERHLVSPLARLLGTAQVRAGDALLIDRHRYEGGLVFMRDKEKSLNSKIHFPMPNPVQVMASEARA